MPDAPGLHFSDGFGGGFLVEVLVDAFARITEFLTELLDVLRGQVADFAQVAKEGMETLVECSGLVGVGGEGYFAGQVADLLLVDLGNVGAACHLGGEDEVSFRANVEGLHDLISGFWREVEPAFHGHPLHVVGERCS